MNAIQNMQKVASDLLNKFKIAKNQINKIVIAVSLYEGKMVRTHCCPATVNGQLFSEPSCHGRRSSSDKSTAR